MGTLSSYEKDIIKKVLRRDSVEIFDSYDNTFIQIKSQFILKDASVLASNESLLFDILLDSFAIKLSTEMDMHRIYYHIYSQTLSKGVFLISEVNNQDSFATSLTIVYSNANWYEREIFEKQGIIFVEHPDLRKMFVHY
ncbi:MAG: NADH-quinone oxidoreductase subunit C [Holosporales bacterium]|nr:NADH-quinone oxidoreductase subunit C [Holosporales bacterium]